MATLPTDLLRTNVLPGDPAHAKLHNDVNREVNELQERVEVIDDAVAAAEAAEAAAQTALAAAQAARTQAQAARDDALAHTEPLTAPANEQVASFIYNDGATKSALTASIAEAHPLARFHRKVTSEPATTVIARSGDSTTQGDNGYFDNALRFQMTNGCALAGMEPTNLIKHGNTGFALADLLDYEAGVPNTPAPAFPWDATVAAAPHLIVASWLTNDARAGCTVEQAVDRLARLIALRDRDLPGTDIAFWLPAPYTSNVVGSDFFAPGVTAASATAVVRAAYGAIRNRFGHVLVIDTAEVYGTAVQPSSPLMQDQLHPNNTGQQWCGELVTREIAPPGKAAPAMGPERSYARSGVVIYAATGLIQISALGYAGGLAPYERVQLAPTWQHDATSDLYCDGGTVDLSAATYSAPAAHLLQISATGVDFAALAPENTIVQLVGDYADDGLHTGSAGDYLDAPALAPGAQGTVKATLPGIKRGQRVQVIPPAAIPAGYVVSAAAGNGTGIVTFANVGDTNVDYGTDLYTFRW